MRMGTEPDPALRVVVGPPEIPPLPATANALRIAAPRCRPGQSTSCGQLDALINAALYSFGVHSCEKFRGVEHGTTPREVLALRVTIAVAPTLHAASCNRIFEVREALASAPEALPSPHATSKIAS